MADLDDEAQVGGDGDSLGEEVQVEAGGERAAFSLDMQTVLD